MTSRSSSSKGLVRDGVRRSLWAVVLSTLTFFMSMLLPSLLEMQHALENRRDMITSGALSFDVEQNWQWSLSSVADRLGGENVLVKIAVFVLAVVVGTVMCRICAMFAGVIPCSSRLTISISRGVSVCSSVRDVSCAASSSAHVKSSR